MKITPSKIDALHTRLAHTRWAPEMDNADWSYGAMHIHY